MENREIYNFFMTRIAWFASLQNHDSAEVALKAREVMKEALELYEEI